MNRSSCCIDKSYYCIWFKNEFFFLEDQKFKSAIPLSFSHLRWFEKAVVEMMLRPDTHNFSKQDRDEFGTTRIQKRWFSSGAIIDCIIWPILVGGR